MRSMKRRGLAGSRNPLSSTLASRCAYSASTSSYVASGYDRRDGNRRVARPCAVRSRPPAPPAARLSDENPGCAGMCARRLQRITSSLDRPDISVPNTNATSPAAPVRLGRRAAHVVRRMRQLAPARRHRVRERGAGQRRVERFVHLRAAQHVVGAARHARRLRIGEAPGIDQMERGQAHGLHRPRGGADVARMEGWDSTMRTLARGVDASVMRVASLK